MDSNTEIRPQPDETEQLLRYHGGKMSPEEMHEMERAALDDPFLADAMDGWEMENDASIIDEIERPEGVPTSSTPSIWQPLLILTGVAVMVFAIYHIQQNLSKIDKMRAQVEGTVSKITQPYIVSPAQDSIDELEIDLSTELPLSEQIIAERIILETPKSNAPIVNETIVRVERSEDLPEPIESLPERTIDSETPEKESRVEMHPIYHVYDLKVADYRAVRKDRTDFISIWSHSTASTPASMENPTVDDSHSGFQVIEVAYDQYLEQAMDAFSREEYKEALRMYRVILKNYPNDVNALFYGGVSYYNLDRQKKASSYLSQAQFHPSRVFDEEAEYYRALSLIHADRGQEADFLLRNIQRRNGFYAEQARGLLSR